MKKNGSLKKQDKSQKLTSRMVAKDFILPYLLKRNMRGLFRTRRSQFEMKNSSVRIKGDQIIVTRLAGVKTKEKFPLFTLITEALQENYALLDKGWRMTSGQKKGKAGTTKG